MTSLGWMEAASTRPPTSIFGSDRHGQVVNRPIKITRLPELATAAFVGTDAACGLFASETVLITRPGHSLSVNALIQRADMAGIWFENVLKLPADAPRTGIETFSSALRKFSPFIGQHYFARRCSNAPSTKLTASLRTTCKFHALANETFCVLDRMTLQSRNGSTWKFILDLLTALFAGDDGTATFGVQDAGPAAWYCSALVAHNQQYQITYDSLQHSLFATVRQLNEQQSPFKHPRCAYLETLPRECLTIQWDDISWAPIVNGFLLKGQ